MSRHLRVAATALLAVLLAASATEANAAATIVTASMTGANERPSPGDPDGRGTAILRLDPDTGKIQYTLLTDSVLAPTAAHIHRGTADVAGPIVVDLDPDFDYNPTFLDGFAAGSVNATPALINEIIANPSGFYVNVHNNPFPNGAIRGQLAGAGASETVFPIAGRVEGANGTFYRTDLAVVNRSESDAVVVFQYFPAGVDGNTHPSVTVTRTIAAGTQEMFGDVTQSLFGVSAGTGAIRLTSDSPIIATARIYNDQRAVDGGTFGQFVPAHSSSQSMTTGTLPMLANQDATTGIGYRTNIGWFNASSNPVALVLEARGANGVVLATSTLGIAGLSQLQMSLKQIFPALEPRDALYLTFNTTGGPLYVYASVVDNKTGDAIFIPAQ